MLDLVWLIPALPLAGFLILLVAGRRLGEPGAGWLATAASAGSFVVTVGVFLALLGEDHHHRSHVVTLFEWLPAGGFSVDVGFLADPLSITMALFVTGIGTLIHLYSIGYMHGDAGFSRFFVYLNLFIFSMLVLVLGDNLLLTFLGWEGVGTCSYFLISFWFTKDANASAGKKAFITNRIGDWGFMVAMFVTFAALGTLAYSGENGILEQAHDLAPVTATAIALLLFVGACGKSAQLPLFVWLPDAMAGPTPVSALIHAATMVTSGVYLMARVNPILAQSYDWAPTLIAWVGVATALFAATIAVAQTDIKKVLAYSTVSQLGYMFLAVGSGAYVAAVFHMVTHAFFKALMFLGSGSVIHGMGDEQDMRRMGGLRKLMPITAVTFIIGWLAIAGVPPFAGFWSKDEILLYAYDKSPALWAVGLLTALLTAFYMSRQVFMVFFGDERWGHADDAASADVAAAGVPAGEPAGDTGLTSEHAASVESGADPVSQEPAHGHEGAHAQPHESPWLMTLPLVVLAGLSIVGGGLNLPFTSDLHLLERWLEPVLEGNERVIDVATGTKVGLAVVAVIAGLLGIAAAVAVYLQKRVKPVEPQILAEGWRFDSSITAFAGGPGRAGFEAVSAFDKQVVDGAVNGVAHLTRGSGRGLRLVQTGFVRSYALGLTVGVVALLAYFLTRVSF
ncbi:MAG: NADH-quinone oxidoreductase subunit L [Acidimicrobiales bacterium]|nr:NADH-quinone oxidoreductase subunit L [Acidimicrobiales bacterium]